MDKIIPVENTSETGIVIESEKELPKEPQETPVEKLPEENAQIQTANTPEQITTLNVVDTRTPVDEHTIETPDKLSALADEDENNFIEGIDTAHGKPKTTP